MMKFPILAAVAMLLVLGPAGAMAAGSEPAPSEPSKLSEARSAADDGNFADAAVLLRQVVDVTPKDTDAWTLLGYTTRKQGKMDEAERYYETALNIDKEHKGALEYLGTLYVQTGRIEEARQMLVRLDEVCFFGCDEFDSLKKKIETRSGY